MYELLAHLTSICTSAIDVFFICDIIMSKAKETIKVKTIEIVNGVLAKYIVPHFDVVIMAILAIIVNSGV